VTSGEDHQAEADGCGDEDGDHGRSPVRAPVVSKRLRQDSNLRPSD